MRAAQVQQILLKASAGASDSPRTERASIKRRMKRDDPRSGSGVFILISF